jgi:hypothetical protein
MGLLAYTLRKRFQQPRFTHARFACQEHHMPVSPRRALPRVIKKRQFALASDDGTGSRGMSGCEPVFDCALTKHLPDRNRVPEALDCVLSQK